MKLYRLITFVFGVGATVALEKIGLSALATPDIKSATGIIVGATASLLGFLVAAGALLYAVSNTTLAANLQRTGHFQDLLSDLFYCAALMFLTLCVATLNLFLPEKNLAFHFSFLELGLLLLVFFLIYSYLLLIPVGRQMWLLLSNIRPQNVNRIEAP
jgi:hypothetical protein